MAYGKLLPLSSSMSLPVVEFCPLANVSICPVSENSKQVRITSTITISHLDAILLTVLLE